METIEKKLQEVVEKKNFELKDDETVREYEKALDNYNELVENGLTEKRESNQLTIEEAHLSSFTYNA